MSAAAESFYRHDCQCLRRPRRLLERPSTRSESISHRSGAGRLVELAAGAFLARSATNARRSRLSAPSPIGPIARTEHRRLADLLSALAKLRAGMAGNHVHLRRDADRRRQRGNEPVLTGI